MKRLVVVEVEVSTMVGPAWCDHRCEWLRMNGLEASCTLFEGALQKATVPMGRRDVHRTWVRSTDCVRSEVKLGDYG